MHVCQSTIIYTHYHPFTTPPEATPHSLSYGETLSFNTEISQKKNTKEQINVFHKVSTAHKTNPTHIDFYVRPFKETVN